MTPPTNHADYVSEEFGSLDGYSAINVDVTVTVPPGGFIGPRSIEGAPWMLTAYFQEEGDDWSAGVLPADPKFEAFRWYAPSYALTGVGSGTYHIRIPLDGPWSAILSSTSTSNPTAFAQAKHRAARLGFVLGGGDSLGHGIYAGCAPQPCMPQPAHISVSYTVE